MVSLVCLYLKDKMSICIYDYVRICEKVSSTSVSAMANVKWSKPGKCIVVYHMLSLLSQSFVKFMLPSMGKNDNATMERGTRYQSHPCWSCRKRSWVVVRFQLTYLVTGRRRLQLKDVNEHVYMWIYLNNWVSWGAEAPSSIIQMEGVKYKMVLEFQINAHLLWTLVILYVFKKT